MADPIGEFIVNEISTARSREKYQRDKLEKVQAWVRAKMAQDSPAVPQAVMDVVGEVADIVFGPRKNPT